MLASAGGSLKFWNVSSLLSTTQIFKSEEEVTQVAWNKDGQYIASIKEGQQEVSVHAVSEESSSKASMFRTSEVPKCMQFANIAGRYLAVADTSKSILIWDLKTRARKKTIHVPSGEIAKLAFSNSDSHIAAGTKHGVAYMISNINSTITGPVQLFSEKSQVMDLKYSVTSRSLIGACAQNGDVSFTDSNTGKVVKIYTGIHSAPATCLCFSPINEILFLSVGYDKRINCYNASQKSHLSTHKMEDPLTSVCFMADGRHIALGTMTGQIFMHDIRMLASPLSSVKAYTKPVTDLKLQPVKEMKVKSKVLPGNSVKKTAQSKTPQKDVSKENIVPSPVERSSPDVSLLSPVRNTNRNSVLKTIFTNSPSRDLSKDVLNKSFKNQTSFDDFSSSFQELMSPVRLENVSRKTNENSPPNNTEKKSSSDFSLSDSVLSPVRVDRSNNSASAFNISLQSNVPLDKVSDAHLISFPEISRQKEQIEQVSPPVQAVPEQIAEEKDIVEPIAPKLMDKEVQHSDNGDFVEEKPTNTVSSEDLAALRNLMEEHQMQTRMAFHTMHFQMLKSFLQLKKEFHSILSQHNSINDELWEENERLREELRELKNTY